MSRTSRPPSFGGPSLRPRHISIRYRNSVVPLRVLRRKNPRTSRAGTPVAPLDLAQSAAVNMIGIIRRERWFCLRFPYALAPRIASSFDRPEPDTPPPYSHAVAWERKAVLDLIYIAVGVVVLLS